MLSWVWQGVWSALAVMRSPILNTSPWAGVLVTNLQSLPPITANLPNCLSYISCIRQVPRVCTASEGLATYDLLVTASMIPVAVTVSKLQHSHKT
jgi:hypothetical protein